MVRITAVHRFSLTPAALRILGVFCVMLLCPPTAAAQDPLPSTLLRRLAETADAGLPDQQMWIVAQLAFPHDIVGVYPTQADAQAAIAGRRGMNAFGPYLTRANYDANRMWAGCVHDRFSTELIPRPRYCPETMPLDSIVSLTLVVETRSRGTVRISIAPQTTDAVFFTLSAYDKFLAPYYSRLYGVEYAARLRAEFEQVFRRRP